MRKLNLLLLGSAVLHTVAVPSQASPYLHSEQSVEQAPPKPVPGAPKTVPEQNVPVTGTPPVSAQPLTQPSTTQPASAPVKQGEVAPVTGTPQIKDFELPLGPIASGPKQPTSSTDPRKPYTIGPEDVLLIRVWGQPDLSGVVTVGPDGMISLQLINEVKADGLTTDQLKQVLTERLTATVLKNPEVQVQVQRVNSRKYTIQGEVNRQGAFPLTGPTRMLDAIANCGGFHEFANAKKIYILRTKPDGTVEKINFNYKDVSHGKHMEQNILIQNGDQIFVP